MPRWTRPGHALRTKSSGWRRWGQAVAVIVLFAVAAVVASYLDPLPPRFTGAARASDGDSLRIGSDRVRLTGLDAPELDQVCWRDDGTEWPCGRAARDLMVELLARGPIDCQPGGTDRFGRTLARCSVGGADLGAAMVESGLAVAYGGYAGEEQRARAAKKGLWEGRFQNPREWRDQGPQNDPGPGFLEQLWTWLRELTGARALR